MGTLDYKGPKDAFEKPVHFPGEVRGHHARSVRGSAAVVQLQEGK